MTNKINIDMELENVNWHLQRNDNLRSSIANRATIVLTANAVVITAVLFLIDKNYAKNNLTIIMTIISLLFVLLSSFFSIVSILSLKKAKKIVNDKKFSMSEMLFYFASGTLKQLDTKEKFVSKLKETDKEEFLRYASTSLWYGMNLFANRYTKLRISVIFLIAALIILITTIIIELIQNISF
jgi:hypothetical protein